MGFGLGRAFLMAGFAPGGRTTFEQAWLIWLQGAEIALGVGTYCTVVAVRGRSWCRNGYSAESQLEQIPNGSYYFRRARCYILVGCTLAAMSTPQKQK